MRGFIVPSWAEPTVVVAPLPSQSYLVPPFVCQSHHPAIKEVVATRALGYTGRQAVLQDGSTWRLVNPKHEQHILASDRALAEAVGLVLARVPLSQWPPPPARGYGYGPSAVLRRYSKSQKPGQCLSS